MFLELPLNEAPSPTLTSGGGGNDVKKSTSMLEMNVIHDIVQFGESIGALSGEPGAVKLSKEAAANNKGLDGEQYIFIDSSDRQEGVEGADAAASAQLTSWSSNLNSVDAFEEAARSPTRVFSDSGSMRRVMSVASLSSARIEKVRQEISTITEEDLDCCESSKSIRTESIKIQKNDAGKQMAVGGLSQATPHADPEVCPVKRNDNRRPSRRLTSGPLRSSLKSSLKLQTISIEDDSHHSMASCRSNNSLKSNVSFSSLEIRSYNVILGDAPTNHGPPISLGWEYNVSATKEYDVDQYETSRAARRSMAEMAISPMDRQWLLMNEAGCRRSEIKQAMKEAQGAMRQREKTKRGVKLGFVQPLEEAIEKARRRFAFGKKSPLVNGGKYRSGRGKK